MSPTIAFFGTPQFSVPILDSLTDAFKISVVVSQPARPAGHNLILTDSSVATYAKNRHLPLLTPDKLTQPEFKDYIASHPVDLAIVAAYGHILPQWLLDWPKLGCINIHASLLPRYRGASPITAALLNGDTLTGNTYIQMTPAMDRGPILYQSEIEIESNETSQSLFIKLSQSASKDINMVLNDYIAGTLVSRPQDESVASYTSLVTKQDGQIDFSHPPHRLDRLVRAYYPWPGVWGLFNSKRVKLLPLNQVQLEGKKPVSLSQFLKAYPDFPIKNIS